jgi:HSP20 family protein
MPPEQSGITLRIPPTHEEVCSMATTLTTYSPFADLGELRERLDRIFDDLTNGRRKAWRLSVDVIEEDDRYVMRADLPGIKAEDVKIEVSDDTLTVSGEHEETKEEEKNYVRRERRYGSFTRSMALPHGVKADDVEATIEDGVLEISIPRPKPAKEEGKAVEIKPKVKATG